MSEFILFISDLHLDTSRPAVNRAFAEFLLGRARKAQALYILGDLFEYWVGDDQSVAGLESVVDGLADLSAGGVPVYLIHGNRDFLLGEDFARRVGIHLLEDGRVLNLFGESTLVMHGDTLCTDDTDYLNMRKMLRSARWQSHFLALPLAQRLAQAQALRVKSREAQQFKSEDITDVNLLTVEQQMREAGVRRLIHGHTHRPAIHDFVLDGDPARRIVLGDWYDQGSVLTVMPEGVELTVLPVSRDG